MILIGILGCIDQASMEATIADEVTAGAQAISSDIYNQTENLKDEVEFTITNNELFTDLKAQMEYIQTLVDNINQTICNIELITRDLQYSVDDLVDCACPDFQW